MSRANAIIKRLPKNTPIIGAEIGVYKGSLSKILLERLPNLQLHMIDRWKAYSVEEITENDKSSMSLRKQETFVNAKKLAIRVSKKYRGRANIIHLDSQTAAIKFEDKIFDFIFIDADHSYAAVYNDISEWLPKVKLGGWICGHDYHRQSVYNAVHEWFPSVNVEDDEDTTWFVRVK